MYIWNNERLTKVVGKLKGIYLELYTEYNQKGGFFFKLKSTMDKDTELFKGKTFADIMFDVYNNW